MFSYAKEVLDEGATFNLLTVIQRLFGYESLLPAAQDAIRVVDYCFDVFQRAAHSRLNLIHRSSPTAFLLVVVLVVSGISLVLGVAPLFGAFVAGILAQTEDAQLQQAQQAIKQFAFASLVPMYFALVGLRLDLSTGFDVAFFVALLVYASALKSASVYVGARWAGERPVGARNLAAALNCRGGPGIVLASLAYDAGIVNGAFYAMLVLLAVVTSIAAGSWLEAVVRRGSALR